MGKRFLKFISDPAARLRGSDKEVGPPAKGWDEDNLASYPMPVEDPIGPIVTQDDIDQSLASADEGAQKYIQTSGGMDSFEELDAASTLRQLAEASGLRIVDLSQYAKPTIELIRLMTADQAKRLKALPLAEEDGVIVVAIADPSDPMISDDVRRIIDRDVELVIAPEKEIKERVEEYYGMGDESLEDVVAKVEIVEEGHENSSGGLKAVDLSDVDSMANAAPVIRLVNLLLVKAIKERASDIHIEPFPNVIRLRYRVDGVLREIPSPPRNMMLGLVSRLKIMGNLDIAETRMPQDGRIKLTLEGREVDLRVSTVPTVHGEAIVMRVLDKSMMMIGISQIGLSPEPLEKFMHHIRKPNGIVLVTGPTGSGKTTTLYAAINEIRDPGEKLITVEDPVEYELPGIVQVNINEGVGLTFARCIRSILRQDPDTVLVGEIRDVETAQIAVQASLTGHLVFSTLHTNSAAATVTRLIDMGVQPFLITSSVEAVIGQRLVRTICNSCRGPYTPTVEELAEFSLTPEEARGQPFFQGEGCAECGHTGFRGRIGLFEMLEITDEMRDLILDQGSTDELQEMAQANGMQTMRQDGWVKICMGMTSFEEVARETPKDVVSESYQPTEVEPEPEAKPAEPEAEAPSEEVPKIEKPAPPRLDSKSMAIEGESGARIFEVGDAEKTPPVPTGT